MADLDTVMVWFRDDLRPSDDPAFHDAAATEKFLVELGWREFSY